MKNKVICPECGQRVKTCTNCGVEFIDGDFIICAGIRGKHFCSEECFLEWLKRRFEEKHTVVETYCETEE
ncbi:MAG TPA: hypothetical protein ENG66_03795 [Thermococcus sp.]|nr:hypothetical protein [Thermococcus sp.]